MAFDKTLDKELFSQQVKFETTRLTVSVFSYNDGTPKLQISRENLNPNSGEWVFSKMGRLWKEEAVAIIPIMQKALTFMKDDKRVEEES